MSWSKIHHLVNGYSVVNPGGPYTVTSSPVYPQRNQDERGVFSAHFSGNPGTAAGLIRAQGKLDPDLEWADIYVGATRVELDMSTVASPTWSLATVNVPIVPQMRSHVDDLDSTNTVTLNVFLIE